MKKTSLRRRIGGIFGLLVLLAGWTAASGKVIYVDAVAPGAGDGTSWENAYNFLQDALADARFARQPVEIRVAQGTYTPDSSSAVPNGTGDRQAAFQLFNGVTLMGGYGGFGQTEPDLRDVKIHETVLSGDVGEISDINDNSYHVVMAHQADQTAILDGFSIIGGDANGVSCPDDRGGGIISENSSAIIANCVFEENTAFLGGGMYNNNSDTIVTSCTFASNLAVCYGGGICNEISNPTLSNCIFRSNLAGDPNTLSAGSGVKNIVSQATLTNCVFRSNSDHGICNLWSDAIVINCTFAGHSVSGIYNEHSSPVITNCILWDGGVEDYRNSASVVTYSDIEGGWFGEGNINVDPMFVDPNGADNIPGTDDDNFRMVWGSPCLDSGDNSAVPSWLTTDLEGEPRIINGAVDMGAYEGPAQSFALSSTSIIVPEGGTAELTVALARDPCGPVQVTVYWESGDADIAIESVGLLVFDSFNYTMPQSVILGAGEDRDSRNDEAVIRIIASGFPTAKVTAIEADNDSIGYIVASTTSLIVPEGGTQGFTVALAWDPCGPTQVTVAWEYGDTDITVESGAVLIFDSSNYSIPQGITLSAGEDLDNSNGEAAITIIAPAPPGFAGFTTREVTATEKDNDLIGYLRLSTSGISVPEGGTAAFTVALAWDPGNSTEVMVTWESGDTDITVESGMVLIFNSSNYSMAQNVMIAAAEDKDWINGQAAIRISVPAPPGYAGFTTTYVSATENDNDPIIAYVDTSANGENKGWDWADAFTDLQDALRVQNVEEIRVAQGIYKPAEPLSGDRFAWFAIPNHVAVKGGYAGFGEPDPNVRDISFYETILSGDLNGDDVEIDDVCDLLTEPTRNDNCYTVVYCGGGVGTLLDGFTITGGNGENLWGGGGLYCERNSSPTISNCTLKGNSAYIGGGIYVYYFSIPTIQNNTIKCNAAQKGGGIYTYSACPIKKNVIKGNIAEQDGGGLCAWSPWSLQINGNTIVGNKGQNGGGMYLQFCQLALIENNIVTGNMADYGGGVLCNGGSYATLSNNTISGNLAYMGGGICCQSNWLGWIENSILWANTAAKGPEMGLRIIANATVAYCDIAGGQDRVYVETGSVLYWDLGNIETDPCFVDAGYWEDPCGTPKDFNDDYWMEGDYHLKSEGWSWDTDRAVWTSDDTTSRCIDAGNPSDEIGNELLSVPDDPNNQWGENLRINMGAYGGTAEASMPPYDWALLADLTNDGIVNWHDFAGTTFGLTYYQPGDLNRDTTVSLVDIALLVEDWLKMTTWH